ncbi:putative bifunctional diguanylate cyclase/phosphodiesterase [Planosporangium sp. 12N6]|uniref:putative bifunctional diguanylate cyclase/phosphodiesterase n=1 Tax=Planosporangium spinosum TaxID=3402278 RepID=UPI003CF3C900
MTHVTVAGTDRVDLDGLARRWAQAVVDTGCAHPGMARLRALLRDLVRRLADALDAEPFDATPGRRAGADLVAADITGGEALGRTVEVLGAGLGRPGDGRVLRLLGALAEGFTQALRERTRDAQEEIRAAAAVARVDTEAALRATEARFRAVFAGAPFGIGIADLGGRLVDANGTLAEMTGYTREELCGRRIADFVHPAGAAAVAELFAELGRAERDRVRTDQQVCRRDGQVFWAQLAGSLIRGEHGEPRFQSVMVEDVTERHQQQLRLRHQALHDPLTGLPNRTLLFDRLYELFESAGTGDRVAVCYIDLDGFKAVNDSFGHDVGDELLIAVAHRLHERVSRAGHLVARMGGDEFVILIHDHRSTGEVVALAEAVLDALAQPVGAGGHRLAVTASIGIVDRDCAATTPAELMRAADITLYWAKADGKGRWALFDADRTDREVARYELSASMPGALDRGEFVLDYQPLVLCGGDTIIGAEALVRWRHPRLGRLAPDRFVALAEETGMIVPLGLWVLEEACRQGRQWRDLAGDAAPLISVNLAVRQAQEPSLVDDVAAILDRTGLEPAYLQLELTESALIGPGHEPLAALTKLAAMGVRIAIDDFGTGYSNLTYLRTLPVQAIKLAGSFVDGLRTQGRRPGHADRAGERMVATLVQLAHALDLTVTAEGVETRMQADRLRAVGCDSGQGFFYAHPGPPERITEMILAW